MTVIPPLKSYTVRRSTARGAMVVALMVRTSVLQGVERALRRGLTPDELLLLQLYPKRFFGSAWFRCEAPEFHHGPRPLVALFHARSSESPRRISVRARVNGRFHCRQRWP